MSPTRVIQEFKAARQRRLNGETPYPRIDPTANLAEQFEESIQRLNKKKNLQHLMLYFDYGEYTTHNVLGFSKNRHMIRSIYKIFKNDPQSILHVQNLTNNDLRAIKTKEW